MEQTPRKNGIFIRLDADTLERLREQAKRLYDGNAAMLGRIAVKQYLGQIEDDERRERPARKQEAA